MPGQGSDREEVPDQGAIKQQGGGAESGCREVPGQGSSRGCWGGARSVPTYIFIYIYVRTTHPPTLHTRWPASVLPSWHLSRQYQKPGGHLT